MPFRPHLVAGGIACGVLLAPTLSRPAAAQSASSPPSWAAALDSAARSALATAKTPGATIAVVVDGRVAYVQGYGVANVETGQRMTGELLLRVGSISKMFTGALLAELEERGALDMQRPIASYVTSLQGKRVGTVTTHQLMTHQGGWIDNAVAYGRMGEGALGEVMREVGDTLFFTEPGRTFSYSNPSIAMAGFVGEVAAGKRFGTLVDSLVMRPAGMARSTFRPLEALTRPTALGHVTASNGTPAVVRPMPENTAQWPAGFLFTSAPELARFAIMLMNGGQIDGRPVLSRGAVRRVTTGYLPHPGRSSIDSAMYGYGLIVGSARFGNRTERVWMHGGSINGYNAELTMLPDRKAGVLVLVNGPAEAIEPIANAAWRGALGITWPSTVLPPTRTATATERASLVGRFGMGPLVVALADTNGALVMKQGSLTFPVRMESADAFVVNMPEGTTMRFTARFDRGRATYLYTRSRALVRLGE